MIWYVEEERDAPFGPFPNCAICGANSPSFDKYRRICRIQQFLADELLRDRDGAVVGGAEIGEVIEEGRVPILHVLLHQANEGLNFCGLRKKDNWYWLTLFCCRITIDN